MSILKTVLILAGGAIGLSYFKKSASDYFGKNLSFTIAGGRIHKISLSGIDLRINIDVANLTPVNAKINSLTADIYYINNGTPQYLANTTISAFNIAANKTNRINDIKIVIPAMSVLNNRQLLSAPTRTFKAIIKANVNGSELKTTQTFTA